MLSRELYFHFFFFFFFFFFFDCFEREMLSSSNEEIRSYKTDYLEKETPLYSQLIT